MRWHWEDKEIRQLFQQLRGEERERAPSFQEVLYRDEPSTELNHDLLLRSGLVACGLLLLSVTLLLTSSGEGSPDPDPSPAVLQPNPPLSLAEWESPTDFLMISSGSELSATIPMLETETWWGFPEETEQ